MKWLDQFKLTPTEKKGFVVLAILLLLVLLFNVWVIFIPSPAINLDSSLNQEIEVWENEQKQAMLVTKAFDPNTVSEDEINSFKLSIYAKKNWLKFRESRSFNEPVDLLKVYGLDTLWFEVNRDSILIKEQLNNKPEPANLFYFDPNTASKYELEKLGLPAWLADRIIKYRDSGGQFTKKEDLQKIYDFPKELYVQIEPYIRINVVKEKVPPDARQPVELQNEIVELNSADSLQLISVKGIGPVFANRIIKKRNQFGGFASKNQLLEVYGINKEIFTEMEVYLRVNPNLIQKLPINSTPFKILLSHPYLNYDQVKAIVNYRETIGPLKDVEDLINLEGFSEESVKRLQPYLSVK